MWSCLHDKQLKDIPGCLNLQIILNKPLSYPYLRSPPGEPWGRECLETIREEGSTGRLGPLGPRRLWTLGNWWVIWIQGSPLLIQLENHQAVGQGEHVQMEQSVYLTLSAGWPMCRGQRTGLWLQEAWSNNHLLSALKLVHFYKSMCLCGSVNYPSFLWSTKPNQRTQSSLRKGFSLGPRLRMLKLTKVPRCQTECPCPNLPHLEAPIMELHLVIVSKVYLYCLF